MAKANCDTEFERWAGEIPEGAVLKDNSIAFIVTKPQTLYALCVGAIPSSGS